MFLERLNYKKHYFLGQIVFLERKLYLLNTSIYYIYKLENLDLPGRNVFFTFSLEHLILPGIVIFEFLLEHFNSTPLEHLIVRTHPLAAFVT